ERIDARTTPEHTQLVPRGGNRARTRQVRRRDDSDRIRTGRHPCEGQSEWLVAPRQGGQSLPARGFGDDEFIQHHAFESARPAHLYKQPFTRPAGSRIDIRPKESCLANSVYRARNRRFERSRSSVLSKASGGLL